MKIAIPVNDERLDGEVCPSFGRAPKIMIYDDETQDSLWIDNPGATSQGGAGIKASQAVVDIKANVLLTPQLGKNAAEVLALADIVLYRSRGGTVMENIQWCCQGELNELKEIHAGFHQHGGQ